VKGVVLETNDRDAAVLLTDGQMIKIKNKAYTIGQEINYTLERPAKSTGISKIIAMAAMFLIFFGSSAWFYSQPYYEVSVDVNPSVLLTVNAFERVIDVTYMNEDAKEALKHSSLKHQNIKNAVSHVIDDIDKAGYFSEQREIMVATAGKDMKKSKALASDLSEVIENASETLGQKPSLSSEAVGYEMVQKARSEGITPGLYNRREKEKTLKLKEKTDDWGEPLNKEKPDKPGKPEETGKPDQPGNSENSGKPEETGKPDQPGNSQKPNQPGKSDDDGQREVIEGSEEMGDAEETNKNLKFGPPENQGKKDDAGKPEKSDKPKKDFSPGRYKKYNGDSGKKE
jgi:hypothetical protein